MIKKLKENKLVFIIFIYFYQISVYPYRFAFSRYAQTLYFYRFIIIGIAFKVLFVTIKWWYYIKLRSGVN